MNPAADFEQLEQRANGFSRWAALAIVCGFGLLLLAFAIGPGGYGASERFFDIQLHLALTDYFDRLGVVGQIQDDRILFGGVALSQIRAALNAGRLLLGLAMLAQLLRLKWRAALGFLAAIIVVSVVDDAQVAHDGYRTAEAQEFGVWLRPPTPHGADASAGLKDADAYAQSSYDRRMAQGARFAADVAAGGTPQMSAQQRAALRYTAAELAYSRRDPAEVARLLNAIAQPDFPTTVDSDWRIRVLREFAQANGFALTPGAYRPVTGWPFGLLRAVSRALAVCGLVVLALALLLTEWGRAIRRRLKRMREMAAQTGRPGFATG